jgi:uncharacterized protein
LLRTPWALPHSAGPGAARFSPFILPGAIVGVALWYLVAATISEAAVMAVLGVISILFGGYRLWADHGGRISAASNSPAWLGTLFGIATGFTSQIAHAGRPPFQMWVMPRKLDRDMSVGTPAIFFAAVNWMKVPAYAALGQFTFANAAATLALLPIAVLSSVAGVKLVRKVPMERFYAIVYWLMVVAGAKLLLDGLKIT